MKRITQPIAGIAATLVVALTSDALADFQRWSPEVKQDPFSGGTTVIVDFMDTIRSGVFVFCNTKKQGIRIRVIPGWAHDKRLEGFTPVVEFAFDGQKAGEARGRTGSIGDNLAAADADLPPALASKFVTGFASASRQVAIKDGMSDAPLLLPASGSTKSGAALSSCLTKQNAHAGG